MRVVVTGAIATYPVGGVAWDYGQYALGLERLGLEVYYLEDTGLPAYDPVERSYSDDPSYGVDFLERSLTELSPSLGERWHVRTEDGRSFGLDASVMAEVVAGADLFLNVSGLCLLRPEYLRCRRKALVDTDPGWNHFVVYPRWDSVEPCWRGAHGFRAHDFFLTYAERIGRPDCRLPTFGLDWRPTRPPVVYDRWRSAPGGTSWTTVMSWNNYGKAFEHDGRSYGSKDVEFDRVQDLPSRTSAPLEIALGGTEPPFERLRRLGWSVVDSTAISATIDAYRDYVEASRGEFSVAKQVYAATRSGWFSCRSVCYLAAGRPVVLQDTGFSELVPTGEGLLAFSTPAEAERAIAAVEADYDRHRAAAWDVAREHFGSERVLADLLDSVGVR